MIQREWQRIDPKYLDEDEQRFWATIAGRQIRFDQRADFAKKFTEAHASKPALETFLSVCAAENPNRRLRMTALQDRVSMSVERADFDDLVTLVTQAPPWEKDRAAGVRILLRAIAEGKANAPDQILQRWTWRLAQGDAEGAGPARERRVPRGEAAARCGRELARAPARGERRSGSSRSAKAMPLEVGAALLASADGYTPRAERRARPGPRGARRDDGDRGRARRQPARAEGAVAQVAPPQAQEEERRRARAAASRASRSSHSAAPTGEAASNGAAPPAASREPKPRRRRRRKPAAARRTPSAGRPRRRTP